LSAAGPLAGLRVVEIGQVLAGPYAGAILSDLGAEVVKVEKPGGDDARHMGRAFRDGDSLTFQEMNRGKASVTLDLLTPEGIAALHDLLRTADILVHNMRPDVPEALGIGPEAVTARHPRLIYCAMSAFGHVGPERLRPGYEPLLQAFSGLCSINGDPDGPMARSGASIVDLGTAMWTVIGALAALRRREETGRGGVVNTSLLETALTWGGSRLTALRNEGRMPDRSATGHPNLVPYQAFDTADRPVMICCGNDRLFAKLTVLLGHPGWARDEAYATNRARLVNRVAIVALIADALRARPRAEWLEAMTEAGIPSGPMNTIPEAEAEPQVAALEMMGRVEGADFDLLALPMSFDGRRPRPKGAAPRLRTVGGDDVAPPEG